MTVEEIVSLVGVTRGDAMHAVLTGGEPMIFEPIVHLASRLKSEGFTITVETAGTVYQELPCDLMSISPKLANSSPPSESGWREKHEQARTNTIVLSRLLESYPYQLKFVIGDDPSQDLNEVDVLLSQLPNVDPSRILLMPEGTDVEILRARMLNIEPIANERGWGTSPRLHIEMFGNVRGT